MKNVFAFFGIIVTGLVLGSFMPLYALINKVEGMWQLAMYANGMFVALVTVGLLFSWTFKKDSGEGIRRSFEDEPS